MTYRSSSDEQFTLLSASIINVDSMTPDQLAELKDNAALRKRLAKRMARDCFRNSSRLEEMHVTHQIDNEEMKALMIDVVDYCYDFLKPPSNGTTSWRSGTIPCSWYTGICDLLLALPVIWV